MYRIGGSVMAQGPRARRPRDSRRDAGATFLLKEFASNGGQAPSL